MSLRRGLTAAVLTVGATAAVLATAGPASAADGCGTVGVPGQDTFEVCNPVIATVQDLLELS